MSTLALDCKTVSPVTSTFVSKFILELPADTLEAILKDFVRDQTVKEH